MLPSSSVLATASLLLSSALATVPQSLSAEFDTELQVNFDGDSSDGFGDGETIPFPDTADLPVFALGDSSGVNTAVSYMIMMLDTTDENNMVMHFMKTDYKATGEKTALASVAEPKVPYTAPGTVGETGQRQYSFLLYLQKSDNIISTSLSGEKFDPADFKEANDIDPAVAGVEMNVVIGDNTGAPAPPPAEAPASAPTDVPADVPAAMPADAPHETMPAAYPSDISTTYDAGGYQSQDGSSGSGYSGSVYSGSGYSGSDSSSGYSGSGSDSSYGSGSGSGYSSGITGDMTGVMGGDMSAAGGMYIGGGWVTEQPFAPDVLASIQASMDNSTSNAVDSSMVASADAVVPDAAAVSPDAAAVAPDAAAVAPDAAAVAPDAAAVAPDAAAVSPDATPAPDATAADSNGDAKGDSMAALGGGLGSSY